MVARHEKLRVKENSDELNKMCDFIYGIWVIKMGDRGKERVNLDNLV